MTLHYIMACRKRSTAHIHKLLAKQELYVVTNISTESSLTIIYNFRPIDCLRPLCWSRYSIQAHRRHEKNALFMGPAGSEQHLRRIPYSQW